MAPGNRKNMPHITALKGISCIMLMVGHLAGVIKWAEQIDISPAIYRFVVDSFVLFHATFWMQLFLVASGFLLAMTCIKNFRELLLRIFRRFLRLGLPVFFSYGIVYCLGKAIGFHNMETRILFENHLLQAFYGEPYNLITVLCAPVDVLLLGISTLDSPFWVLSGMFYASILLYLHSYLHEKTFRLPTGKWLCLGLDLIFLVLSLFLGTTIFTCTLGAMVFYIVRPVALYLRGHFPWFHFVESVLLIASAAGTVIFQQISLAVLLFSLMLIVLENSRILQNSLFLQAGAVSFGIYSLHWPIFCSAGCWILLHLPGHLLWRCFAGCAVSFLLTAGAAVLFHLTCEKWSTSLTACITGHLSRDKSR